MKSRKIRQYRAMFLGFVVMSTVVMGLTKMQHNTPEAKALVYEDPYKPITQDILDENERQMTIYNYENGIFPSVYINTSKESLEEGEVIEVNNIKYIVRSISILKEEERKVKEMWEEVILYEYNEER